MWNFIKRIFKKREDKMRELSTKIDKNELVKTNLEANINYIKKNVALSSDLNFREFVLGASNIRGMIIYLESMVETNILQREVLKPLISTTPDENIDLIQYISNLETNLAIPVAKILSFKWQTKGVEELLAGKALLYIDGVNKGFILDIRGGERRSIGPPQIEASTHGPQEGFVELMITNLTLIRRRIKDNRLKIEALKIGKRTKTDMALVYLDDLADKKIVDTLKERIKNLTIDGILDVGQLNQLIEDNWVSPFPQVQITERPDRAVANLLEGRVLIVLDGTPFIGIVPTTFVQFLQTPEDYYDSFLIGSALRIIRLTATVFTLSLPAVYISLVSFHHELIPHELAMTIARTRQQVPFPAVLEALIMELSLELLREAGLRLPGPIGQTIGIVGGLILGDAAVRAGLVSPPTVIVVGLTAISSFIIPTYTAGIPLRLLRFPIMIMASILSVYGIMISWLVLFIHLLSLESFDQPYFAPFGPIKWSDLKDSFIRFPLRLFTKRPVIPQGKNLVRQKRTGEDSDEK